MVQQRGRHRDAVGTRPLARHVLAFMEDNGMTSYEDFRAVAAERGVKASGETFRKAATDGYKAPLRDDSVKILAAGTRTEDDVIRHLDFAYWGGAAAPVGAGIDPDLLAELAEASPTQVAQVRAYLQGIRERR